MKIKLSRQLPPPQASKTGTAGVQDMPLNLEPNIASPDDFYEKLINMQRDLSEDEVQLMNAKLILVLANHIGDPEVLDDAMTVASS
jgi:hypothetical protein